MVDFTHLHVHSQYSILDGAASINSLIDKAIKYGMTSIALTDHGTLLGIKEFHSSCLKKNIKPILGCEAYVANKTIYDKSEKEDLSGNHLIILVKNITGYYNLLKLISTANTEGFYQRPRIDKNLLKKHKEGLIISSACLGGEIPRLIYQDQIEQAKQAILWYKDTFGDDYYLEIMYHPSQDPKQKEEVSDKQLKVNNKIIELGKELNVKVIATNDVHFVNKEDAEAHDVLICLTTNADINDPNRMRYTRQEWFKTQEEMLAIFPDNPEVLANTMEIANKVETFIIDSDPIMPEFPIPDYFGNLDLWKQKFSEENLINEFGEDRYKALNGYETVLRIKLEADYLKHLVLKGAKMRYGENYSEEIKERIEYELNTIKTMGFPGYFLIVQDFIAEARELGVLVGKGRGSAAGSVVAYCTKITDVDPIEFNLLFERFLNPDRISMPDVDIDFDDDGRALVIDYVTKKYGKEKVAHICTIGTMKAKGAIRDVSRIIGIPLNEVNALTKKIPGNGELANAFNIIEESENKLGNIDKVILAIEKELKEALNEEKEKEIPILETRLTIANEIKEARNRNDSAMIKAIAIACTLEGSVRQTGVHACGMLIGKNNLENNIPLMRTKDGGDLYATQYDGTHVESIGLLKMDFLGLRTLSIIKETIKNIEISKKGKINIDVLPLNDKKTLDIFKTGATTSIFQFESEGMKSHLKALKPNHFNDLIAMNALYRPGPMEYIKDYISRKHGLNDTVFDHPIMEEFLKDTYGITVFQEQVMLQARALAGFSRGESDNLRKAMGKKKASEMEKLYEKFVIGCKNNPKFIEGCNYLKKDPNKLIEKIWKDWASFAKYAFNKSHSVCYAYIAFQTAYLKAHYPAEFMAANLTRNISEMDKISTQMEECKRMKIKVLGPDVNESFNYFTVNKKGNIRFGLNGIKNVGTNAVANIIEEREKNGNFKDIFDFVSRVNLNAVNKKNIEALVHGGALDCFAEIKRIQYFSPVNNYDNFVELLIKFGNSVQNSAPASATLFGDSFEMQIQKPEIPKLLDFNLFEILKNEKEHIGMYLSGHPLDPFKFIIEKINITPLSELEDESNNLRFQNIKIVGYVTEVVERISKNGNPYGKITIIDYTATYTFSIFGKSYTEFKNYFEKGYSLLIQCGFSHKRDDINNISFNISKIHLLADAKENLFQNLTLRISSENVTEEFIEEFIQILKKSKGKMTLNLSFSDKNAKTEVKVFSRNTQIKLSDTLIEYLEANKYFDNIKLN